MSKKSAVAVLAVFSGLIRDSDEEALKKGREIQERETRRQLLELAQTDLFSENGKFYELPKEKQVELLDAVLTLLEEETEKCIVNRQPPMDPRAAYSLAACGYPSGGPDGIDWDEAHLERCDHLLAAAKNGVFLPDWRDRIESIKRATRHYHSYFCRDVVAENRQRIRRVAEEIENLER